MPGEGFNPIETVRKFLEESECSSQIRETTATIFTVADASAAVGAPEKEILKSILLRVNHGKSFALALMSGVNRVDTKKIKRLLGASHVSFADGETCTEWSGFRAAGGLSGTAADAARRGSLSLSYGVGRRRHRPRLFPSRA